MQIREEVLRLWHPDGRAHTVKVYFASDPNRAVVAAEYLAGHAANRGSAIANWSATYEGAAGNDLGSVYLGDGRIDLEVEELRGIGLGSLLMRPLIAWIKDRPHVPVQPINLAGDDARTADARDRRNRFYEKLGFAFNYEDDGLWGESIAIHSSALVVPPFQLSRGWKVETLQGAGQVF